MSIPLPHPPGPEQSEPNTQACSFPPHTAQRQRSETDRPADTDKAAGGLENMRSPTGNAGEQWMSITVSINVIPIPRTLGFQLSMHLPVPTPT